MATSYRDGFKVVDGSRIKPVHMRDFRSSNGMTVYTAILWEDGESSCNCPGWAMRKRCRHSQSMLSGNYPLPSPPRSEPADDYTSRVRRLEL